MSAFFFVVSFAFLSSPAIGGWIEVDTPVVVQGESASPGDLLMEDPVAPSRRARTQAASGSGGVQKSLSDQIALPVAGTGAPGGQSQFRGLGRSAEDTDVQAFGIPLNPPQGGGFDLSVFPQFLWSGYAYQPGPALGTFDPRGTAGSLVLTPWTASALQGGLIGNGRLAAQASSSRLYQVSGAWSDGERVALVAGASSGDAQGPSVGLSARHRVGERLLVSTHLLATDLEARIPGPGNLTPHARQRTMRAIPLLQADLRIADGLLVKSGVYVDASYLKYEDPSASALPYTQDHVAQVGTENALLWGRWKLGASARGVRYSTLGFATRSEAITSLLLSRSIGLGSSWSLEPTLRGVGVSRYGLQPEGSLGARGELGGGFAVYARAGFARKFPSMLNRFYSYPGFPGFPGFVGNPELSPERVGTALLGLEWQGERVRAGIQNYGQVVDSAQVRITRDATTDTMANVGRASVDSLLLYSTWDVAPWLSLRLDTTWSVSSLSQSGRRYPGLPTGLGVLGAEVRYAGWALRAYERISGNSTADATSAAILPAYHEEDFELEAPLGAGWQALGRVDDLTDQRPEHVRGYPARGRTVSVLLSRTL